MFFLVDQKHMKETSSVGMFVGWSS